MTCPICALPHRYTAGQPHANQFEGTGHCEHGVLPGQCTACPQLPPRHKVEALLQAMLAGEFGVDAQSAAALLYPDDPPEVLIEDAQRTRDGYHYQAGRDGEPSGARVIPARSEGFAGPPTSRDKGGEDWIEQARRLPTTAALGDEPFASLAQPGVDWQATLDAWYSRALTPAEQATYDANVAEAVAHEDARKAEIAARPDCPNCGRPQCPAVCPACGTERVA
jgi:hypothetical protein